MLLNYMNNNYNTIVLKLYKNYNYNITYCSVINYHLQCSEMQNVTRVKSGTYIYHILKVMNVFEQYSMNVLWSNYVLGGGAWMQPSA